MATLTQVDLDNVMADIMREYSKSRIETPITKPQLTYLLETIDQGLESAEASIVSALPNGDEKDWLLANTGIARRLMAVIEEKRREVL